MRETVCVKYKKSWFEVVTILGLMIVFVIGLYILWISEEPGIHNFFLIMGLVVVGFALFCIMGDPRTKTMRKYRLTEEILEDEFRSAEEVCKNQLYVSDNYVVHMLYAGMTVFKVEDIVWMHKEYIRDSRFFYRKEFYIVIYTNDRKKNLVFCPYPCHDEKEVDCILAYFDRRFPHILTGYSKEAKRTFEHEFERFLKVKYNYGLMKRKHARGFEKQI